MDWQEEMLDDELTNGIQRMGALAAFVLDKHVDELQHSAFEKGLKMREQTVRAWMKMRKSDLALYADTEYGKGVKAALTDLDHFLQEINKL
jgi:hypothetical protein